MQQQRSGMCIKIYATPAPGLVGAETVDGRPLRVGGARVGRPGHVITRSRDLQSGSDRTDGTGFRPAPRRPGRPAAGICSAAATERAAAACAASWTRASAVAARRGGSDRTARSRDLCARLPVSLLCLGRVPPARACLGQVSPARVRHLCRSSSAAPPSEPPSPRPVIASRPLRVAGGAGGRTGPPALTVRLSRAFSAGHARARGAAPPVGTGDLVADFVIFCEIWSRIL